MTSSRSRIWRLAAAALWVARAFGQQEAFRYYGQDEGLRNLAVQCLAQDQAGFLWVGTQNGLFRYDGDRFVGFGRQEGLPSSRIEAVHETRDGRLWVGTRSGLAVRVGDRFERAAAGAIEEILGQSGIDSDAAGQLYVGTAYGLVIGKPAPRQPHGMQFQLMRTGPAREERVFGVHVARDGRVWFGCGYDICRLDGRRIVRMGPEQGVPSERWDDLVSDDGDVWARSGKHLIVLRRGAAGFTPFRPAPPPSSDFAHLYLDRRRTLYVTTSQGLAVSGPTGFGIINKERGLITNAVRCVTEDREGSLWLGLSGAGLARWLGRSNWQSWTQAQGLSDDVVWAIARDASGALWVGTDLGLNRAHPDEAHWEPWSLKHRVAQGRVRVIAADPDGTLWVGFSPGTLGHIDPRSGTMKEYGPSSGLPTRRINYLALDGPDRVWVAGWDGLFRGTRTRKGVSFTREELPGGDAHEIFFHCFRDRSGRMWAAGSRGLARLDSRGWKRFTKKDGLRSNYAAYIVEDGQGAIWLGYREAAGVSRLTFDGDIIRSIEHYSTGNGLFSDQAIFVGADSRGWIWFGSDSGVDVFDGLSWRHFGRGDGLIWDDCDGNAFFADRDGGAWIGTSRGLSHVHPNRILDPGQQVAPPVVLTEVFLGSSPREGGSRLSVPFGERSFRARFAAMSFVAEKQVRFRYRLSGMEERWTETDQREVLYPRLPHGSYQFEVAAAKPGGPWTAAPASFSFEIQPPWWDHWGLRLAAGAVVLALSFGFWRWRTRRMRQQQQRLQGLVDARTRELVAQKQEIEGLLVEAQQATRLKSEFLANMSHEIRTPMNGILGFTALALDTDLTQPQREYLEIAKDSADSLLSILNDVLDFSKIEAGRLDLEITPFYLRQWLEGTCRMMEPDARKRSLGLQWHVEPETPDLLLGDSGRLRQIILNLLSNAVKFTHQGRISVEAAVAVRTAKEAMLHFSVSDTGIGIAEAKQALIFQPFRQADGSTTRRYGGTGLGLAICSRLVEMQSGRIWVESKPGRGSTFHFTLPFGLGEETVPEQSGSRPVNGHAAPISILLAEDNAMNQALVLRMLERTGHRVSVAATGCEALEFLAGNRCDLVLMDVQMPEMDGLEATRTIREREKSSGAHVPIVALTAHAMKGDRERCIEAGMDGYIAKPIRPDELLEVIARVADSGGTSVPVAVF